VERAAEAANPENADMGIVSAGLLEAASRSAGMDPASDFPDYRGQIDDEGLARRLGVGTPAKAIEVVGHPADATIQAAETEGTNPWAIGSRGRDGMQRPLMRPVLARVAYQTACNV
jgi:hypothetical protein